MNIETVLLPDEEVLYRGSVSVNKSSKNIIGFILLIAFVTIVFLIIGEVGLKDANIILMFIVALLFLGFAIYGLICNLFLKNKNIIGNQYFITTKRAIIYSVKKKEFKIGNLDRFDVFRVDNEKDKFGDVYMGVTPNISDDLKQRVTEITDMLLKQDKNNMDSICFASVENPYQVLELVKKQRKKLAPNKLVFEDVEVGQEEIKISDQKVIIYKQPVWVWCVYIGIIIVLLFIPIINIFNSLKIWNTYSKTTAIITNVETNNVNDGEYNIKYFVNVVYTINSNEYEGKITNNKCYFKSIDNSRFRSMKKGDKVNIYVNPNKLIDLEYVPTLLTRSSLILLLFSIIVSFPLLAKTKTIIKNI